MKKSLRDLQRLSRQNLIFLAHQHRSENRLSHTWKKKKKRLYQNFFLIASQGSRNSLLCITYCLFTFTFIFRAFSRRWSPKRLTMREREKTQHIAVDGVKEI